MNFFTDSIFVQRYGHFLQNTPFFSQVIHRSQIHWNLEKFSSALVFFSSQSKKGYPEKKPSFSGVFRILQIYPANFKYTKVVNINEYYKQNRRLNMSVQQPSQHGTLSSQKSRLSFRKSWMEKQCRMNPARIVARMWIFNATNIPLE